MNGTIDFSDFWLIYPRKIGKRDAEKAWNQAIKRGVDPAIILAEFRTTLAQEWIGREKRFIPYPSTFLRSEAFESKERVEALNDNKEHHPVPRIDPEVLDDLIAWQQERWCQEWEVEVAEHQHGLNCDNGRCCRFANKKI